MLTAPRRFGSSMRLHVHVHCTAIDGVYTIDEHGPPGHDGVLPLPRERHCQPASTDVHCGCATVATRALRLLRPHVATESFAILREDSVAYRTSVP
jgi:hypothetical protein